MTRPRISPLLRGHPGEDGRPFVRVKDGRARLWWEEIDPPMGAPSIQVHESEDTFTGLYDADGRPLHRPKGKVGF